MVLGHLVGGGIAVRQSRSLLVVLTPDERHLHQIEALVDIPVLQITSDSPQG